MLPPPSITRVRVPGGVRRSVTSTVARFDRPHPPANWTRRVPVGVPRRLRRRDRVVHDRRVAQDRASRARHLSEPAALVPCGLDARRGTVEQRPNDARAARCRSCTATARVLHIGRPTRRPLPCGAGAARGTPLGNILSTAQGVRWIDLEAVSRGPLEWDLAFLDVDAVTHFSDVDAGLLALLRPLNSARVAIWCWARADMPGMRSHAEHHLDVLRRAIT